MRYSLSLTVGVPFLIIGTILNLVAYSQKTDDNPATNLMAPGYILLAVGGVFGSIEFIPPSREERVQIDPHRNLILVTIVLAVLSCALSMTIALIKDTKKPTNYKNPLFIVSIILLVLTVGLFAKNQFF